MMWKDIYRHLTTAGFEVYSLGQHEGECKNPYLVLRDNGVTRSQSIETPEFEVLLYYPMGRYSGFSDYIRRVKGSMNELYPALKLADDEAPHYPDNDKRAYMTSLIYRGSRISRVNRIK